MASLRPTLSVGLFVVCLMIPRVCPAQTPEFVRAMSRVLAVYDTANTLPSIMDVAHEAELLTVRYSDEWLAHYWTAFLHTQVPVYSRDGRYGPYTEIAQYYFDKARATWEKQTDKPEREAADLFVLEGFIHSFKSRVSGYDKDDEQALYEVYLSKAEAAEPEHPIVWSLRGMRNLSDESTREKGIQMIRNALTYYQMPRISSIHPYWSIHFLPFWLERLAPHVLKEVEIKYEKGGVDLGASRK